MTREIVTEKFAENFDPEYVSCDFPLISVMCAKNDYTGCHILKLVTGAGVVAMAIVDPDGYPLNRYISFSKSFIEMHTVRKLTH